MASYEERLFEAIGDSWVGATPGMRLQVHERGRLRADLSFGQTYPVYDWASLTKIVFSVSACMVAYEEKNLRLTDLASKFLPFFADSKIPETTLGKLLSHSAGLPWWLPYYEKIDMKLARAQRSQQLFGLLKESVLATEPLAVPKAVYSDLDFFCVGFLLEQVFEKPLLEIWDDLRERMGIPAVTFSVDNVPPLPRSDYAPTEACFHVEAKNPSGAKAAPKNAPKNGPKNLAETPSKKTSPADIAAAKQGEVHDENAWALGGVAPHSGLFGSIENLSAYGLLLRKSFRGERAQGFPRPETTQKFAKRATPREEGDWACGFMLPSKEHSSAGRFFDARSIGHTGFTGTSLWLDPRRDLLVTILANRVHPTRENKKFIELRAELHNCCVQRL